MKNNTPAFRIWFQAWLAFVGVAACISAITVNSSDVLFVVSALVVVSFILALPAVLLYLLAFAIAKRLRITTHQKLLGIIGATGVIAFLYAVPLTFLIALADDFRDSYLVLYFIAVAVLFLCGLAAVLHNRERITSFFHRKNMMSAIQ